MAEGVIGREVAVRLLAAAREAATRAYVPYSGFPVGAAILTRDGSVIPGCNVENASYPLTVCAERVAVGNAVAAGHREVVAIAVTAPKLATVTPCGGCRQVLNEFQPRIGELLVVLDGEDGPEIVPLSELLPRSFGPRSLNLAIEPV
ncbi:MAG: cytidine deaminase [Thermomicrobiales bacterium]